jgi:hypothetical protein
MLRSSRASAVRHALAGRGRVLLSGAFSTAPLSTVNPEAMPGHLETHSGNVAAAQMLLSSIVQAELLPSSSPRGQDFPAPFIIGVAGGTASGKTSVCKFIIKSLQEENLEHHGILSLPLDCYYRDLNEVSAPCGRQEMGVICGCGPAARHAHPATTRVPALARPAR